MQFVYTFIPKEVSLKKILEKRTRKIAKKIVMRTSNSMELEDQKNMDERLDKAIKGLEKKLNKRYQDIYGIRFRLSGWSIFNR